MGSRTGLTSSGQFLGTIDYVAPEQIRGISVLGLADQYSLGCVLYECLTGRVPFEKDLDAAIIWAHVEESPTQPTVLRPDLPPDIDDVFARVLAKNPGDRFETCKEFMTAAREALGPMADPPSRSGSLSMRLPRSGPAPYPAEPEPGAYLGAQYAPQHGSYQGPQYGSQPEGYPPTEFGHDSADAFTGAPTASWPSIEAAPPLPLAGRPAPPLPPGPSGGRRRSRRRGRGRGRLVAAAALVLVAGGYRGRGDDCPDARPRQPGGRQGAGGGHVHGRGYVHELGPGRHRYGRRARQRVYPRHSHGRGEDTARADSQLYPGRAERPVRLRRQSRRGRDLRDQHGY